VIIDASDTILGRLCSISAKMLLEGKKVIILNAEKAVISGYKSSILRRTISSFKMRSLGSLEKSPKHPRRPEGIIRRGVRGMLPWKKPTGKKCFKKLSVYIGVPEEFKSCLSQKLPIHPLSSESSRITVGELAKAIGWNSRGK